MSKVITVMNMKGGVGKTVVAAHLGGMLARYKWSNKNRRVLLIDYDPQFNLSQMFIPAPTYFTLEKAGKTARAILQDDETIVNPFKLEVPGSHEPPAVSKLAHPIYSSASGGALDMVCSTLDLMYLALGQAPARTTVFEERFRKFISRARGKYNVIIIDCHPAGSLLTKTALTNSDDVLIPVVPTSRFAARGLGLMKAFISASQLGNSPNPHILFNLRKSVSKFETAIRNDPKHAGDCLAAALRSAKAFSDPAEGKGFVWASGRPYSTLAFNNLSEVVEELVMRLSL